jgi:hypothetical protein
VCPTPGVACPQRSHAHKTSLNWCSINIILFQMSSIFLCTKCDGRCIYFPSVAMFIYIYIYEFLMKKINLYRCV